MLKDFVLPVDMESFLSAFWDDAGWYEKFLTEKLEDLNVKIDEWTAVQGAANTKSRSILSYHPSKISFPGLPSHAEVCQ